MGLALQGWSRCLGDIIKAWMFAFDQNADIKIKINE